MPRVPLPSGIQASFTWTYPPSLPVVNLSSVGARQKLVRTITCPCDSYVATRDSFFGPHDTRHRALVPSYSPSPDGPDCWSMSGTCADQVDAGAVPYRVLRAVGVALSCRRESGMCARVFVFGSLQVYPAGAHYKARRASCSVRRWYEYSSPTSMQRSRRRSSRPDLHVVSRIGRRYEKTATTSNFVSSCGAR